MFTEAVALVEQQDRESHDSDFELDIVRRLLSKTLQMDPNKRSLQHCIRLLRR